MVQGDRMAEASIILFMILGGGNLQFVKPASIDKFRSPAASCNACGVSIWKAHFMRPWKAGCLRPRLLIAE